MNKGLIVLLVLLLGAGYWMAPRYQGQVDTGLRLEVPGQCQLHVGDCEVRLPGDAWVEIHAEGEIRPLSPFKIFLKSDVLEPAAVSFEMVGMDMGINRYSFTETPSGGWKAEVMLPVCTVNRTDWVAVFNLRSSTVEEYLLEYPFNVASGKPQ